MYRPVSLGFQSEWDGLDIGLEGPPGFITTVQCDKSCDSMGLWTRVWSDQGSQFGFLKLETETRAWFLAVWEVISGSWNEGAGERQGRKEKKLTKAERELVTAVDIWILVPLKFLWRTTLKLLPNRPVKGREAGTLFADSLSSLVESCPGGHFWKLRVLYWAPPPPLRKPRLVAEELTPQALEVEAARVFQELMTIPVCQEFPL